ncbi:MAG: hypothetical protein U0521_18955 [Anaerolineae bacterium]
MGSISPSWSSAEADDRDGIWYTNNPQPGGIQYAVAGFRECPLVLTACTVDLVGGPFVYNSLRFEWNNRSDALLIELYLPGESRRAFAVVGLHADPTQLPRIYRYDYASWSWDGARVLASGGGEDGRVGLRWIDPATGDVQMFLDSGAGGLWLQNAVQRPGGEIVALGSALGANSPMRLFDGGGVPLTDPIGTAAPERVVWSPDRSAALVAFDGFSTRYYVASVSGAQEITEHRRGAGGRMGRRGAAAHQRPARRAAHTDRAAHPEPGWTSAGGGVDRSRLNGVRRDHWRSGREGWVAGANGMVGWDSQPAGAGDRPGGAEPARPPVDRFARTGAAQRLRIRRDHRRSSRIRRAAVVAGAGGERDGRLGSRERQRHPASQPRAALARFTSRSPTASDTGW